MFCKNCEKEFKPRERTNYYCSRECFDACRPKRGEETKKLASNNALIQHKNMTPEMRASISSKISLSNKKFVTEDTINRLKYIFSLDYVSSDSILAKKLGLSKRVLYRIIEENLLQDYFNSRTLYVHKNIQLLSEQEYLYFLNFIKNNPRNITRKKYKIGERVLCRFCKLKGIKLPYASVSKWETSIEKEVRLLLEKLNVPFKREVYINRKRFRVDFIVLPNKVIEVNGDYWHANPDFYDEDFLTNTQKSNIKSFAEKKRFLYDNDYELLEVWENELKTKKEETIKTIIKYAKGN